MVLDAKEVIGKRVGGWYICIAETFSDNRLTDTRNSGGGQQCES